jgi:hypothetical protein
MPAQNWQAERKVTPPFPGNDAPLFIQHIRSVSAGAIVSSGHQSGAGRDSALLPHPEATGVPGVCVLAARQLLDTILWLPPCSPLDTACCLSPGEEFLVGSVALVCNAVRSAPVNTMLDVSSARPTTETHSNS